MALRDDTLRAYRDFRILDASGDEIGRSLSYWLMLNIDTRRPVRVPDEIMDMAPQNIAHVLGIKNDRLKINMKKSDSSKTFHVRQSDLDMNRHVNNVKYIEWALAALDDQREIHEIDIEFRSECRMGDSLQSNAVSMDHSKNVHRLIRTKDEQTVAVAETYT